MWGIEIPIVLGGFPSSRDFSSSVGKMGQSVMRIETRCETCGKKEMGKANSS
jgi:hypothetical protein